MTESFPGETFPALEEIKMRSLKNIAASGAVAMAGLVLNKFAPETEPIGLALVAGGGVGAASSMLSYSAITIFEKLNSVEAPTRRTFGVLPKNKRDEFNELFSQKPNPPIQD